MLKLDPQQKMSKQLARSGSDSGDIGLLEKIVETDIFVRFYLLQIFNLDFLLSYTACKTLIEKKNER